MALKPRRLELYPHRGDKPKSNYLNRFSGLSGEKITIVSIRTCVVLRESQYSGYPVGPTKKRPHEKEAREKEARRKRGPTKKRPRKKEAPRKRGPTKIVGPRTRKLATLKHNTHTSRPKTL